MIATAQKIEDKLLCAKVPMAIFVKRGVVSMMKTNTEVFQKRMEQHQPFLMGVYTFEIFMKDLIDDLNYMGAK